MEFSIEKESFVKALQKIQGIVERRNTIPILSNVLIEATDDLINLTATDLEVGMKSSYHAAVNKNGKITISAKKLYEIIREFPDEKIKFSTRENNWVDISCGKAKFNIVGLSSDEFPSFQKIDASDFISLDSSILSKMIEQTSYSICQDETKYNLNGILFKITEENDNKLLRLVATDGHRLCVSQHDISVTSFELLEKGVILPKKGIYELKKLCDEDTGVIKFGFIDNSVAIVKDNTTVVMRLVDGEFPDYKRVVPVGNDKEILVNREIFLHSLKRMAILSSEKFKGIKFEITDNFMEISSSNPELGEAKEDIEVKYTGPKITTRFNARYLIDVLNILNSDNVLLVLKDEMSPAIIKQSDSNDFISVIMPMRL